MEQVRSSSIDTKYLIDHLCYRVADLDRYDELRDALTPFASEVATTIHNNRKFSIFKLKEPLRVRDYSIPMIELPTPEEDNTYAEGLEHLEMVVDTDFDVFCMENEPVLLGHIDDTANPTVRITYKGLGSVRFHPISLEKAVELQGDKFVPVG